MPAPFDPKSPNMARVYDAMLGGKDNLTPDRSMASELAEITPYLRDIAAGNRLFQARAVSWLASQGITQFIDLGCGMPSAPNTHETAQEASPGARGSSSVTTTKYSRQKLSLTLARPAQTPRSQAHSRSGLSL